MTLWTTLMPLLTLVGGFSVGVLFSPIMLRWLGLTLDGTRQRTPALPTAPVVADRPLTPTEEAQRRLIAEAPPFSPETVTRGVESLRNLYIEAGHPVPRDTELRRQVLQALAGEDIT